MIIYDKIGATYNVTRKADPFLTEKLYSLLNADNSGIYLDIGCGTGNYLTALSAKGLTLYGIDPSATMLERARGNCPTAQFIQADSNSLPIADAFFDGAIAVLTIHHWQDMAAGLKEVRRVLKPGTQLVIFGFTGEQMRCYWLCHYFPVMMETCADLAPGTEILESTLTDCGFRSVYFEPYFVRPDLEDHFLYSSKFQPERYLIPEIRNNASAFSLHADEKEVAAGVAALTKDIETGKINRVMKEYENELGDYLFIVARA